jgi:Kef-type K+ transport system membrane component KefB/nucleotide-binding universal stress UspA family protein
LAFAGWFGPGKWVTAACFVLTSSSRAFAASGPPGHSEALFLTQLLLLLLIGRLLGEAMQRFGQSSVMGQLIAGILLGPSVFGAIWPEAQHAVFHVDATQKSLLEGIAGVGILLLLLLTGMETDLKLVAKERRAALAVSAAGIIVPFALGFALGGFLPDSLLPKPDQRLVTSLFLGTALSIASVKIVATVVRDLNFTLRRVGVILLAAAITDDTIGWIIIAITLSIADHGAVDTVTLAKTMIGTALFLIVSFTFGKRAVFHLIRAVNDNAVSEMPVVTAILIVTISMALVTYLIGVHTVLGAFVAGMIVGQSPILTHQISEQLRGLVAGFFMPVFFGLVGLNTDLTILTDPSLALYTAALIVIASAGKFGGAFIGGAFAGLTASESLALGCGMNARGSTEVIVATIGLSMGVLSQQLFTMIVGMAVVTTMAMPPMLRWAVARIPIGADEKKRLEQEDLGEKGFVARFERMLAVADESKNGALALRLAGLIAGARAIPMTILRVGLWEGTSQEEARHETDIIKDSIESAAQKAGKAEAKGEGRLQVSIRVGTEAPELAVLNEARKGYDILVLGLDQAGGENGQLGEGVDRIAAAFKGPLAIAIASDAPVHSDEPLNILVPVRGNEVSLRAAEVALALAKSSDATVTALHVLSRDRFRFLHRPNSAAVSGNAMLSEIRKMADAYGQPVLATMKAAGHVEEAILRQARQGRHNLIVLGVNRPAGDPLYFGSIAAGLKAKSGIPVLLIVT